MDPNIIIKEFWMKLLKEWWPVLTLIIMGLVALYFEERLDKQRKRTYRRQAK